MKNQYFGDVNDYRKYGLLRALCCSGNIRIFVCWMLTADDGSSDGRFIHYLAQPEQWRPFDPPLYDALRDALLRKKDRCVDVVERRTLIPSANFFRRILTRENRPEYFGELRAVSSGSDLIFFDPDNGMEVRSVPRGRKGSAQYLFWDECCLCFSAGHSLLVYQHFPREKRERYVTLMSQQFLLKTRAAKVVSLQTRSVVYFLVPQPAHTKRLERAIDSLGHRWGEEFTIREHDK